MIQNIFSRLPLFKDEVLMRNLLALVLIAITLSGVLPRFLGRFYKGLNLLS